LCSTTLHEGNRTGIHPRHQTELPALGDVLQMTRLPQPLQHSLARVHQPQGHGQHHRSSSSAAVPCSTSHSVQDLVTSKALHSNALRQNDVAASWKPVSTPTAGYGRCQMVTMPTCTAWGQHLMRRMSEQCRQDYPACKSCQQGWEMAPWCSLPVGSSAAHATVDPGHSTDNAVLLHVTADRDVVFTCSAPLITCIYGLLYAFLAWSRSKCQGVPLGLLAHSWAGGGGLAAVRSTHLLLLGQSKHQRQLTNP